MARGFEAEYLGINRAPVAWFNVFFYGRQDFQDQLSALSVIVDAPMAPQRFPDLCAEIVEGPSRPESLWGITLPSLANPLSFVLEQVRHGC